MLGRDCRYQRRRGRTGILLRPLWRVYGKITLRKELPTLPGTCSQAAVYILFSNIHHFVLHSDSNASAGARIRRIRRLRLAPLRQIRLLRPARQMPLRRIQLRRLAGRMPLRPIRLLRPARPIPLRPIRLRRLARPMPP